MIRSALIARAERATGESAAWMRDVAALGSGSFVRLMAFQSFANVRGVAATGDLLALARLGAVMAEDCGPCTRIVMRMARRAGLGADVLECALSGGLGLSGARSAAFEFGRAVASGSMDAVELGETLEALLGRKARTELAIAAATVRVYPALKRGLGYAASCSAISPEEL